ncbi:hypothetical protein [Nocardiopsis aegyptia]|uniref:Uncharacterized protein n=1 Tax=Nocardiopsis aegyptia TaxID=220378 RepID=A0A7Z0J800_9ACTN|nr:hypothetical protein [Nocardiopsis aegyptia]NYJ32568.1 hypothetical protein [Nocardiopsis aegyptia]
MPTALMAVVLFVRDVGDWANRGTFEVVELSADGSQAITGTLSGGEGPDQEVDVHATVLTVILKNNSEDLKVFDRITVETESFVPVTECVDGQGGPITVTASYEISLPAQGEESHRDISYALEPKKAEALELPIGSSELGTGVARIRVALHESGGDIEEVGSIAVLASPGTGGLYPRPLHTLPIGGMPSPQCVHDTHDALLELVEDTPTVADNVRTLTENVGVTSRELGG